MHKISVAVANNAMWALVAVIAFALYVGWNNRNEFYITAERGLGYAFGITGLTMMVLLLLYPLSKRWMALRDLFAIKHWFRIHMMLGIVGPTFIIFHTNFHLGSTNSNVALFSMLIVVASGVIGRYLYRKIHHGLYGHKVTVQELSEKRMNAKNNLGLIFKMVPDLEPQVERVERMSLAPVSSLTGSFRRMLRVDRSVKKLTKAMEPQVNKRIAQAAAKKKMDKAQQRQMLGQVSRQYKQYFASLVRACEYDVYDRLFAWWHILHVPLFILLFLSAVFHVYAVHVY